MFRSICLKITKCEVETMFWSLLFLFFHMEYIDVCTVRRLSIWLSNPEGKNINQSKRTYQSPKERWGCPNRSRTLFQICRVKSQCKNKWSLVSISLLQLQQFDEVFIPQAANRNFTERRSRWQTQKLNACLGMWSLYQIIFVHGLIWSDGRIFSHVSFEEKPVVEEPAMDQQ